MMFVLLLGHDLLQAQRIKSNYAYASMEVSARLNNYGDEGDTFNCSNEPPTPGEHNSTLDPETGMEKASEKEHHPHYVKREPTADIPDDILPLPEVVIKEEDGIGAGGGRLPTIKQSFLFSLLKQR